ncbi:MAG TPA: chitobiase/beta-hexosaminidase C-terminal domain-containing protein [Candidatus Dormibacteraeota bacterium]|nr:chitobiase/beta-hexosaminidase C-terminal domain-containing protein [Candidatus Dormibacteraeota bacterium]
MKLPNMLNSAGDTIVEVMIVLAVLGLSFSISYATANHGLIQSRNAEEHSEALGLLDSQVELLRAAFSQNSSVSSLTNGTDFCMKTPPANPELSTALNHNVPTDAASDNLYGSAGNNYPAACFSNSFYNLSIHYDTTDSSNPFFDLRVRWDGLGNLGRQQEELTYKISPLSITGLAFDNGPVLTVPSTPAASPPAGTYTSPQSVSLTSIGPGTPIKIYYTTDGSSPDTSTTRILYNNSTPITVSRNKTIKAIAYNSSNVASGVLTAGYVIVPFTPPRLSVHGGTAPGGAFYPSDTVVPTVIGVPLGDSCVIKDSANPYFQQSCSGSFSASNLPQNQTSSLTAYVAHSGRIYASNSVSVKTITPTCPWGFHQSTASAYQQYIQYSGNYSDPPNCVPLSF